MKNKVLQIVCMITMLIAYCYLNAEILYNYGLECSIGGYSQITDQGQLGDVTNDDDTFTSDMSTFDFQFNNQSFDYLTISTNGYIAFAQTADNSYSALANGLTNDVVSALNANLVSKSNGSLRQAYLGEAPNRMMVIQWTHYKRFNADNTEDLNFQIQLHEGSNLISFHYGPSSYQNVTDPIVFIGLRGESATDLYNLQATSSWWDLTFGSQLTDGVVLNTNVSPVTGFKVSFISQSTENPLPDVASVSSPLCGETGVSVIGDLEWSTSGNTPILGSKIYLGTDNPPTNILNGVETAETTCSLINLIGTNTTYYWKIVPFNNNGTAVNCPVWSFTTSSEAEGLPLAYENNLESGFFNLLPIGWKKQDLNNDGFSWMLCNSPGQTGQYSLICTGNSAMSMNDWLISPPFMLEQDNTYRIRFFCKKEGDAGSNLVMIKCGTSSDGNEMSDISQGTLWVIGNTEYELKEGLFTPTISGVYYFGIQGVSPAQESAILIDDLLIEEYNPSFLSPIELSATSQINGIRLSWTAPENVNPIGYRIRKNGELIDTELIEDCYYLDEDDVEEGNIYHYQVHAVYYDPCGWSEPSSQVSIIYTPASVQDNFAETNPCQISDIYPNPFNPSTSIQFSVAKPDIVMINIYNVKGQKVRTLLNKTMNPGSHTIEWNGRGNNNESLSSGVYYCTLNSSQGQSVKKILMIK